MASLDHDRILRAFLGVIQATLRTNFFQREAADGAGRKPYVAFKLDPQAVPDLPAPAADVRDLGLLARGSRACTCASARSPAAGCAGRDRREDFRTEVLGLVKAQMVKNAVIVPTGAKGGFVAKQLPDPAVDREAWLAEGIACYKHVHLRRCSTSPTTCVGGEVVPPPRVVRHDGDDPYLVVAADKGTATFSDIANGVAPVLRLLARRRVRLRRLGRLRPQGDGHHRPRRLGVGQAALPRDGRRHPDRGLHRVGVGDMSGDVFGNGMLLSEHIRLVAAFDHRHIFLDPDPDAATSYAERRRLFDLPRSSWADYDTRADLARAAASSPHRQVDADQPRRCARRSACPRASRS